MTTTTAGRAEHSLPETLRAIEAGRLPAFIWSAITNGEHEGYIGYEEELRAAQADIELGSVLLAGVVEPLRSLPGYLWLVANSDENAVLGHGIAPTLAEAKAAVEAAAADLATAVIQEGT